MTDEEQKTEHEKSVIILKAMGWHPVVMPKYHLEGWYRLGDENGNFVLTDSAYLLPDDVWRSAPNLYSRANIYYACRIANRMGKTSPRFVEWWLNSGLYLLPRAVVQARWLDKIVELILKESK